MSGLPHAVVKQAENFRVREFVKKIESHPHREALQADLQQNNVYNPFSDELKAMIREMVLSYLSFAKQIQKCNAQNAFFIAIKEWSIALVDISWLKANPVKILTNGDWMLSPPRTASSRRCDPIVLGTIKLKRRNSTIGHGRLWPNLLWPIRLWPIFRPTLANLGLGARHGKTDAQKERFVAHNARKRWIKKNFDGIHDRF